jgi:hypothetical protein
MSESTVSPPARWFANPEAWILLAALLALVLKLALALRTFGTNDVAIFYKFGRLLSEHGLQWTYLNNKFFNHPPVVGYYIRAIYDLAGAPPWEQGVISFPFLLRLPGIASDFVVVLLFLRLRKLWSLPAWSLIALALSPVSLMVSGFHGNTDPVMVMFLFVAAYMCAMNRPAFCGMFLALSCQIKIIPLLLLPIFACFWFSHRKGGWFLGLFAAASGLLWLEPLLTVPGPLLKHVFSYGSFWGLWGITYWLRLTGQPEFATVNYVNLPAAETFVSGVLKLFVIACVLVIAWRRRNVGARGLFESLAYGWIVFFIFSPGVCAQYLVWLVPFVLVLSPSLFGHLLWSSSLFLFFFYNTLAHGLPWDSAISTFQANTVWTQWSVWPWVVLIAGAILIWESARRDNPSLRLLSLEAVKGKEPA